MNWLNRLLRKDNMDKDLEKELEFHIDRHTDDLIAQGHSPKEARRMARLTLGGMEQVKEKCREARGTLWLEDLFHDFRYAIRTLRQRPGFAAVSILTLALGIGAVTAIFSAVNPILFEPLPYPNSDRVMTIWYAGSDGSRAKQSFGSYEELVSRSRSFEYLAVFKPWQPTMISDKEPERFDGQRVSVNYFRSLGVPPALGRDFQSADDQFNGPNVVIISNKIWQRNFGGDRSIVGRQITLNDSSYTVIGVMPNGFENVLSPSSDVWTTLQYNPALPVDGREWGHHLDMVGRLRAGVGIDQARREVDAIAHNPVPEFNRPAWSSARDGCIVYSLKDNITGSIKPTLMAVLGAVILVLLIACVNVTNLLLARGAQRRGEFAMRVALGARRSRLVRQMLTESLLLAIIGGAFGMLIADSGVRALVALSPSGLPRIGAIHIDATVFLFAMALTALIGIVVGLIPAINASRGDLLIALQVGSRSAAGGHQVMRRTLVIAELALALMLLVSAGLLLRSLNRLFSIAPGFDSAHLVAMQVQVASARRYPRDNDYHEYYTQVLESVRSVPGVSNAALTSQLPLSGDDPRLESYKVTLEPHADGTPAAADGSRYAVSEGYFEAMGIPLLQGRVFDKHDTADTHVRPVVVSESFAKVEFPGRNPVGQRLKIGGPPDRSWDEIVGVVGDVKQASLAAGQPEAVYVNTVQWLWAESPLWLVVRARGDAASLVPDIKKAVWSVDKDQPVVRVNTMDDLLAASEAQRRFALLVFETFAVTALTLAAIGIYGLMSGSVTERTREIGVRTALGATPGNILTLVFKQGIWLTVAGTVIGLVGAVFASQALSSLLYGITGRDPVTYVGVVLLLIVVSVIACWLPAWRAARVDPSITLRAE